MLLYYCVYYVFNVFYLDKNMGMFLICWDKFFGIFQVELLVEEYELIWYGLIMLLKDINVGIIIFYEWLVIVKDLWQEGIDVKICWKYVFGLFGYSYDGIWKISKQMWEELKFILIDKR